MNRHVLVGLLGEDDLISVRAGASEKKTEFNLLDGNGHFKFGINHLLNDMKKLSLFPSELGLDFLVLAAHVYAADTRISRIEESQDAWTREIRLIVPVSDKSAWQKNEITLNRMLNFLTGDKWNIQFRSRPNKHKYFVASDLECGAPSDFDHIALYSGGLDSLIGAIDSLESGKKSLFVSHAGEGAVSIAQDGLLDKFKEQYKSIEFQHLRLWMVFPGNFIEGVESENSTRGRSFLFIALGVCIATALNKRFDLHVPENGFIALNVPLDPLRLGSNSTKTTHPFYLGLWNILISNIGLPGAVSNPYWNKTKGEMFEECKNQKFLKKILPISMSCSAPSKGRYKGESSGHCGYCLPCIIRRAAIEKVMRDTTNYHVEDLTSKPMSSLAAEGIQIRSFQYAVNKLKSRNGLENLLVYKSGPLGDDQQKIHQLAGVYKRGLLEVESLIKNVVVRPVR